MTEDRGALEQETRRLFQLLEGHTVRYGDDEERRYSRGREPSYRGREPLTAFTHAVEFGGCKDLPVRSHVVLDTELFCVRAIRP